MAKLWLSENVGKGSCYAVFDYHPSANFKAESISRFGTEAGLPSVNGIYHFQEDLIFATSKGLYTFQSETQTFFPDSLIGVTDSVASTEVISLVEDQEGKVWMERKNGTP